MKKTKEINALQTISDVALSLLDFEKLLNLLLDRCIEVMKAQIGAILIIDEDTHQLYVKAVKGIDKKAIKEVKMKTGEELAGKVALTGELMIIQSIICAPLKSHNKIIGVVHIDKKEKHEFTKEEINLFKDALDIAGMVIEHTEMLRKDKESLEELKELNKIKTDFLSIVSHEMSSPITTILGYLTLMLRDRFGKLTDKQREIMDIVRSQSYRLSNLANDLLDLSRFEAGRIRIKKELVSLDRVIKRVIGALQQVINDKKIVLKTEIPENLPPVIGDESRIAQVLTNLINNAIKFVAKKRGEISIRVSEEPNFLQVEIADNGIGIPPDQLKKVFERFYQVEIMVSKDLRGAGLGLAISKQIIDGIGGEIWAESEGMGKGSRFCFTLPTKKKMLFEKVRKFLEA